MYLNCIPAKELHKHKPIYSPGQATQGNFTVYTNTYNVITIYQWRS